VALDQGIALKLRDAVAALVRLSHPHARHDLRAGVPKALNELDVVLEMFVQGGPLCR
jgi:hypothetical protein